MKKSVKDSYELYESGVSNPIDKSSFLDINNKFMKFISNIVMEGHSLALPEKVGTLQIIGKKEKLKIVDGEIKGLAPDWVNTKIFRKEHPEPENQKKIIYHLNKETSGVRYRWFWSKKNVLIEGKKLYSLRMSRSNKRNVGKKIKEGQEFTVKIAK